MSNVPPPPIAPVSPPGPGATRSTIVDDLTRGWSTALVRGLTAFIVMAALGQAAAFIVYFVGDQSGSIVTFTKLGWFYFDWFHHIELSASVTNVSLPDTGGLLPGGASIGAHFGLALMLGTFLAIWLLYGAGKAVADQAEGSGLARVLHGLKVAPVYAVPCLVLSLLVKVNVTLPPGSFASGSVELKSSAWQSFLIPLLIAAAAGAAGGLRSGRYEFLTAGPWGRRVSGALAGGLRMLALGIVLSFVGLLVLAVVRPDATKAYFRTVSEPPVDETILIIGHHVLLLPNQSMWVLVPAMGACDGAYGSLVSEDFLCYWKYPTQVSVSGGGAILPGLPPVRTEFGTAPTGYFLFLLVPLISVWLGGRHAVRKRASFRYEAVVIGAAAGVFFGILVAVASWFASFSVGISGNIAGFASNSSVRIGPQVLIGGVVALAWGIVGGGAGGWWAGRDLPSHSPLRAP